MLFDFQRRMGGASDLDGVPRVMGGISQTGPGWLAGQLEKPDHGLRVIDVREPYEYEAGHIEGAELVPLGSLIQAASTWDRDPPLVMVCRSGARSARATMALMQMGFATVHNLQGGMIGWSRIAP
ncbi:MAG: rhodanese-like domain-containing protein [Deltaproteobacteria bacterium]|nr:rhodanese-like domain-containing protein [Deltaproteobacteria bacterium]